MKTREQKRTRAERAARSRSSCKKFHSRLRRRLIGYTRAFEKLNRSLNALERQFKSSTTALASMVRRSVDDQPL